MKFGIMVNEGPFTHEAADSAYQFVKAALAKGHQVLRVFFYYDGVNNANRLSEPQADDRNLVKLWGDLAREHDIDLVVRPLLADQEMRLSVRYWEGAVAVQSVAGDTVGHGYVELTGYVGRNTTP